MENFAKCVKEARAEIEREKNPPAWESLKPAKPAGDIRAYIEWQYYVNHGKYHYNTPDCEAIEAYIMRAQLEEKAREEKRVHAILEARK